MLSGRSLIYKVNNNGPKTEPCGTPLFTRAHWELTPFSTTLCRQLCRKLESHLNMLPSIPYDFILLNNL